jgi:clostripain
MSKFNEHSKNLKIYSIMKRIKLEKLFALGIIFLLLTSTFLIFIPKIEAQNRFSGKGSGTPSDPYVITNVKQLQEMKYDLKAHYVLGNDIDASETRYWNNGQGFEPIGDYDNPFTGSFDGKGYKIYNLYINRVGNYTGLFGYVGQKGIIKNVGLENVEISSTGGYDVGYDVGGLIGRNEGTVSNSYSTGYVNGTYKVGGLIGDNSGRVSNCYSTGSVNGTTDDVGGLIGRNEGTVSNSYSTGTVNGTLHVGGLIGDNSGTVSNCYSTGYVNGRDLVGGLIGFNVGTVSNSYSTGSVNGTYNVGGLIGDNFGTVSNCYSTGTVNGKSFVGGLIGDNYFGTVSNCYSTGTVNGKSFVGGLIGGNYGIVSNCYSTGSVNGTGGVGGLIGHNDGTVSNSYSTGSVNGTGAVGGLIGHNDGIVSNCYSTGSVNGNNLVGGLIGYNERTVSNSFWDIQTSGRMYSAGGTGKTTAEMKNVRTYTDVAWSKGLDSPWDFVGNPYDDKGNEDIWDIKPNINNGYPYLTTILSKEKWTVMAYLNGDNNLEGDALRIFNELEKAGSTPYVNIVALIDRHPEFDSSDGNWASTRLYKIDKDDDLKNIHSTLLEELELNMGDVKTLSWFIEKVMNLYPAEHYALILFDHGYGWEGISYDWSSNKDYLDMTELKEALSKAKSKIDLLIFDACLMSMVEVAYQIKDYVNLMVASEAVKFTETSPGLWGFAVYPYTSTISKLMNNPNMNAKELAKIFIEEYAKLYEPIAVWAATISALDLSQLDELADALDELALLLIDKLDSYKSQIKDARDFSWEFMALDVRLAWPPIKTWKTGFIDLGNFLDFLKYKINDEEVKRKVDNVKEKMKNVIFDKWDNVAFPHSGLSIYFPSFKSEFLGKSGWYAKLSFSIEHYWDDFLSNYFESLFSIVSIFSRAEKDIEGVMIVIDYLSFHFTPVMIDLTKGEHSFDASPLYIDWSSKRIYVFDHWENKTLKVISYSYHLLYKVEYDGEELYAIYKSFGTGTAIILKKSSSKLYLHAYDNLGRHVGFNHEKNQTEIQIPGSYYYDDLNGTISILLPANITDLKIIIDATKSEQPIENYSLMIQVYKEGNLVSSTSLSSQININTKKEYSLQLTGDLKPILNELTTTPTTPSPSPTLPTPTQPPSPTSPTLPVTTPIQSPTKSPSAAIPLNIELIIIIIVIAATLASLVIVFRKYKTK